MYIYIELYRTNDNQYIYIYSWGYRPYLSGGIYGISVVTKWGPHPEVNRWFPGKTRAGAPALRGG